MDSVTFCIKPDSCEPVRNHRPGLAGFTVDAGADIVEDFGHVLNLVENHGWLESVEKALRVVAEASDDVGVFQQVVAGLGEEVLEQVCFAGAAWAGENHTGKAFGRVSEVRFDLSWACSSF